MKTINAVLVRLRMLPRRTRVFLAAMSVAQVASASLDVIAIACLGVVTSLATRGLDTSSEASQSANLIGTVQQWSLERWPEPNQALLALSLIAVALFVAKSLFNAFSTRFSFRHLAKVEASLSAGLLHGVLAQPVTVVRQWTTAELTYSLTNGVNYASTIMMSQALIFITESSLLAALLAILFAVDWQVTLVTLIFLALIAILLHFVLSRWARQLARRSAEEEVQSVRHILEPLRTFKEMKVFDRSDYFVQGFRRARLGASWTQGEMQFLALLPKYIFETAVVVGAAILIASQLLNGNAAQGLGLLVIFLAAGSRIVPALLRLQGSLIMITTSAERSTQTIWIAKEVTARDRETQADFEAQSSGNSVLSNADIMLSNVEKTYDGRSEPSISGASLEIFSGQHVALIGSTGSGKTTLMDLMLGLVEPTEGTVTLTGLPPRVAIAQFPGRFAYVPQQAALIGKTLRENLAYGLPEELFSEERAWECLELVGLKALADRNGGLDMNIGEDGTGLSGGQRQRVGLARALYSQPDFLFLDEATSALDTATEEIISAALRELDGRITRVTISHRIATVEAADVILLVEGGRIAARGTYSEVKNRLQNSSLSTAPQSAD